MKKKFLGLGLSFLLVAALVLTACQAPVVEEPVVEEPVVEEPVVKEPVVEEPVVGLPQYGGTLTMLMMFTVSRSDPPSPDIADGFWAQTHWLAVMQERPLVGDFVKYGPRGTGEFGFQLRGYNPMPFMKGDLLEGWEISPEKVVWYVRPGIYWQGRDVMESRELTAEDIVADLIYFSKAPGGRSFREMSGDIYATNRYTLVIEFSKGFNLMLMYLVGYEDRAAISPPEIEGSKRWEDQVGTGPFMFKEYVIGSHMSFERNPNWGQTATIDGVEYQLPFVDEMIWPIIPDESTQIAALRTGKIDWHEQVAAAYWSDLAETAPRLLSATVPGTEVKTLVFLTTEPPFDDVNVRRAMMIGTVIKAHMDLLGVEAIIGPMQIDFYPIYPGDPSVYVPLEELPAEARLLYDYNPELASKMLREAGIPEGFKMELTTRAVVTDLDISALLEDQWAKIGLDVEIQAVDEVTYAERRYAGTYKHSLMMASQTGSLIIMLSRGFRTGGVLNWGNYSNEDVDELIDMMTAEMDTAERNRLAKEAALIVFNEVHMIPLQPGLEGHYWWPWLKNYYGERNVLDFAGPVPFLAHVWIDQDLKAEMGY